MKHTIALAGNPNAGKTSLFNVLTGTRQYVGNWAGVTVEKKEGWIRGLRHAQLVDLPGIYSLSAQSLEEKIAISYILDEAPETILNIVDASNLERNLYFTIQILEMGLPTILVLNMMDVAKARGLSIDVAALEHKLGTKAVPVVARKGIGCNQLLRQLETLPERHEFAVPYPSYIETAIAQLVPFLQSANTNRSIHARWLATMWLEKNTTVEEKLRDSLPGDIYQQMISIRSQLDTNIDRDIRDARYQYVQQLLQEVVTVRENITTTWSDRIDTWIMHRIFGIPLFLVFMFLVFQLTFNWGGTYFSNILDDFMNDTLHASIESFLQMLKSPEWFTRLVTDGILNGVGSVLVFVPQITIMFFCLSFLEDSGYMARAAVLMDRFMNGIGLNGKAFIPLILGFGCNVPAIMATRTLEDHKGRLVTTLISPFMSCSARLSVYSLFVAAFFQKWQAEVVFALYVTGIVMAIATAYILQKLIHLEEGTFLLEIPPYRVPMLKSLLLHTWDKAKGFVRKAGTIIFGMSVLLWLLGNFNWHGFTTMEHSLLAEIGQWIAPLFAPMHFSTWQAGVSLLTGFLAKEVVISTMSIAYGAGNETALGPILHQTFTSASALSFLFFILLYTPCISTVATMKRETGSWKWTLCSILYSLGIAWVSAFIVYELASLIFRP